METCLKLKFIIVVTNLKSEMELGLINVNQVLDFYQTNLTLSSFAGEVTTKSKIIEHIEKVLLKKGATYDMEYTLALGQGNEHIATVHLTIYGKTVAPKAISMYPFKKIISKTLSPAVRQIVVDIINSRKAKKTTK